jgi:phosphoribosylformylglycinamidine synthase subunit PurQ / glutaminase
VTARIGVVTFPGTLDDRDAARAVGIAGAEAVALWHADADLKGVDAVILPGGFSYGDYLRAGAISRFARVMDPIVDAAKGGMPVLGICNGFQVLCESHLLPGAMIRNVNLQFVCRDQGLSVENTSTAWTRTFEKGQRITIPIKNQDGQYIASNRDLDEIESEGRVVFRYAEVNPNGSARDIAGVCNVGGNVVGLMPHPEHAVEPGFGPDSREAGRGGVDGLGFFRSVLDTLLVRS